MSKVKGTSVIVMKKPIIGILGSVLNHKPGNVEIPANYVNSAYYKAVEKNGGIPFVIPFLENKEDVLRLIENCDGLLFPGGDDVDTHSYGEEPHAKAGKMNLKLDEFWIYIERIAEERRLPILGICRGLQLINVSRGGSLYQDLSELNPNHFLHVQKQERSYLMHKIKIERESFLNEILEVEEIMTNTLHHQCVKKLGKGLKITAYSNDGIPEAVESNDGRIVLVQWHPEELTETEPRMNNLFKNLIQKSSK